METYLENIDKILGGKGRKAFNSYIIHKTNEYQKKYGFDIGDGKNTHNNEADAFKHAYMQWVLGYYLGSDTAKKLGDMHEEETPNAPFGEINMDKWNNAIGREIAEVMKKSRKISSWESASDEAAKQIFEKLKNGDLITNPSDKRKFENMEFERLRDSDKVHYKGEFTKPLNNIEMERYLEQAIDNNWKLPEKYELDEKVRAGSLIYVNDYTKTDGTKVNGYYRRKGVR